MVLIQSFSNFMQIFMDLFNCKTHSIDLLCTYLFYKQTIFKNYAQDV